MKKNICYLFLLLYIIIVIDVFATNQNVGTTTSMFKVFVSPKVVALGGAYSTFKEIDALVVNPASVAGIDRRQVSIAYNSWLVGSSYGYIGFGMGLGVVGSVGVLVNYFYSGEIEETDINGPTGERFTATGIEGSLVYGRSFIEKLYVGLGLKYISEAIEKESAATLSMDIGSIYSLSDRIRFSLVLKNLFGSIKFIEEEAKMPMVINVGCGVDVIDNLTTVLDIGVPLDNNILFGLGVEYGVKIGDIRVPLRLGYRSGLDAFVGVALGVGVVIKDLFELNLSWMPTVSDLNQHTLNVGLGFRF